MKLSKLLVLAGSVAVGDYLAERFILKATPDDPRGLIPVTAGFGLDELVRAGCALAVHVPIAALASKFIR